MNALPLFEIDSSNYYHLQVCKAEKTVEPICDAIIQIGGNEQKQRPPEFTGDDFMIVSEKFFINEAESIGEVLCKTLPGGTLDQLLIYLLKQKASRFRVAHVEDVKKPMPF